MTRIALIAAMPGELKPLVRGWPHSKLRDLLPDRIIASHPELFVGERDSLRVLEAPALNA